MLQGSSKSNTRDINSPGIQHNGKDGTRVCWIPRQTCGASGHKEVRNLQYNSVMDPGKSLVCSTEGGTFMPARL